MTRKKGVFHTFLSYKGGTGRTVTSLNVAFQAAKLGQKVLIIDLDIDGPGLGVLANIKDADMENERKGIVKYLASSNEKSPVDYIFRKEMDIPGEEGKVILDFMPAPQGPNVKDALPTHGYQLKDKMDTLRKVLIKKYDLIVVDAASGVSDYTALALAISDYATICIRWSQQHLRGSIHLITLLGALLKKRDQGYFLKDFFVLPNAVPDPQSENEIDRKESVLEILTERLEKWKTDFSPEIELENLISESNELKWNEGIVLKRNKVFSDYEKYTQFCLTQHSLTR